MIPMVQALESAGIATLLLKGAAFVADTRLDAGMRPMNDVDVLVPTAQAGAAIDVLLSWGLCPSARSRPVCRRVCAAIRPEPRLPRRTGPPARPALACVARLVSAGGRRGLLVGCRAD